MTSEFNNKK